MTDEKTVSEIEFSNNRVEGKGRKTESIPVETLVEEFLESEYSDPEWGSIDWRLSLFIAKHVTDSGLERFAPIEDEEIDALIEEYNRQRD